MLKTIFAGWLGLMLVSSIAFGDPVHYKIVTGPERGTYIQIGHDLAKWVADPAGIDLEVDPSKGSAENVQRMRYESGVKLALVQSDVYQAFVDMARAGNSNAEAMIKPLRLIMPLYNEEIYFVVRSDSPMKTIDEIKGKKISVGLIGSGTAESATTLYRLMFGEPIPEENAQHLSNEDALAALIVGKIDVAIVVAGQPAKLFTDMKPDLLSKIKLLKFNPSASESVRAQQTYFPATIRAANYPNWLKEDSPTLTVKAFLVTYDYGLRGTVADLTRFADSLCTNFDNLQEHGHPKWKQVKLELPSLGKGWQYYAPVAKHLRACVARRAQATSNARQDQTASKKQSNSVCTDQARLLLLCQ